MKVGLGRTLPVTHSDHSRRLLVIHRDTAKNLSFVFRFIHIRVKQEAEGCLVASLLSPKYGAQFSPETVLIAFLVHQLLQKRKCVLDYSPEHVR